MQVTMTTARRAALAAAGGLALYAAHPPLDQGWLGLLAVAPLLALARDVGRGPRPLRAAMGWGTLAGLAFFLPLLRWIMHIQEWVAWPLLALAQGAFLGLFLVVVVRWGDRPWRPAAAVVAWVGVEALRSVAPLGGFAWGVLGYSQAGGGLLLDLARSFGVLGVSAACAAVGAATEDLVHRVRTALRSDRAARGGATPISAWGEVAFSAAQAPLLGVIVIFVVGVVLGGAPPEPTGRTVDVAGVQGLADEGGSGRVLSRSIAVAEDMRAATRTALDDPRGAPDLLVWPENAIDGDPSASPELAAILDDTLDLLDGSPLLSGAIEDGAAAGTHRNTMLLFDDSRTATDRYVKRRLVPFGEYVPARPLLSWYPPLARVPSDGIPGTEPSVISAAGARIGVGICFDVVFPRFFHQQVREGADVLVLATNNSSYGRTAMSDQHIAFSQLRAVESGRWVVHAALSGRSAIVDPSGGVQQRTAQYEQAIIRADVPLVEGLTLATRLGDAVGWLALALTALGLAGTAVGGRVRGRRAGNGGRMSEHEDATDRDDIAEELDRSDPMADIGGEEGHDDPDETGDRVREQDQAWAGDDAMEGTQPSS
jgi:apolipoprotein N-acyltransferase